MSEQENILIHTQSEHAAMEEAMWAVFERYAADRPNIRQLSADLNAAASRALRAIRDPKAGDPRAA